MRVPKQGGAPMHSASFSAVDQASRCRPLGANSPVIETALEGLQMTSQWNQKLGVRIVPFLRHSALTRGGEHAIEPSS
jgi:hypothetical protein